MLLWQKTVHAAIDIAEIIVCQTHQNTALCDRLTLASTPDVRAAILTDPLAKGDHNAISEFTLREIEIATQDAVMPAGTGQA